MNRHQLADAMIKGLHTQGVKEDRKAAYVCVSPKSGFCRACALGCALIGKFDGDYMKAERIYDAENMLRPADVDFCDLFAELLGIPPALALEIEFKHLNGMTVQQIAAWLKSSEETEAKDV